MQHGNALPRFLLNLSLAVRLLVAIGSILLFLAIYILLPDSWGLDNPIIFAIPVALVAWMFRKVGVYLALFVLCVTLWLYGTGGWYSFWPSITKFVYFFIGMLGLLCIGLFISGQREAFDLVDEAQYQIALAYEQQQKLHEAKDQFLQNVNHELRTPLTAIYGYLELLLEHNANLDQTMRATFIEHAMQSCDELQMLVNNVLDSMTEGREKRKRIQVEETVVMDVVHEVLERFDPQTTHEHTISVDVPDYIVVMANPQYVRQVLRNLLSNAFKYAPAGTPIGIRAYLYREIVNPFHPAPEICIEVKDAGPGIPLDEQNKLFRQFVRLRRDTSKNIRGSGLGLYLSKQFVELMGGHIWVESEGIEGKGSYFRFTLPCVPRPTVRPQVQSYKIYTPAPVEASPVDASPIEASPATPQPTESVYRETLPVETPSSRPVRRETSPVDSSSAS